MLRDYLEEVEKLRKLGKEWNISNEEIEKIIDESFRFIDGETRNFDIIKIKQNKKITKKNVTFCILLAAVLAIIVYNNPFHILAEQNVRELIYPSMKFLRKLMLPVVRIFPAITEWYDEACLLSNPYFQITDLDCWPCRDVKSILNLTTSSLKNDNYHTGIPFILKDNNLKKVDFSDLQKLYIKKKRMFDKDAPRILSFGNIWTTVEQIFETYPLTLHSSISKDSHIVWKLNRLEPTREVRSAFGFPQQVPNYVSGITPEKFIFIDEPISPVYNFPSTEGTTIFMVQGSGSRLIILEPSPECKAVCHRVSILLEPHHILWFSWWYWRGRSVPVLNSTDVSVTYLGSYY